MKVLKNATQKNVLLAIEYYTRTEIEDLLKDKAIGFQNEMLETVYELPRLTYWREVQQIPFRVFLEDVSELKVVYNHEFECYENIAVMKDGRKLHVNI